MTTLVIESLDVPLVKNVVVELWSKGGGMPDRLMFSSDLVGLRCMRTFPLESTQYFMIRGTDEVYTPLEFEE